jgi:Domain of unknown function (DUF4388)
MVAGRLPRYDAAAMSSPSLAGTVAPAIPNAERLQELARLDRGSLTEVPIAVLFRLLAEGKRTVTLKLTRRAIQKSVAFDHGVPVEASSNLIHETLSRFLIAQGRLSEQDCQECLVAASSRHMPLGEMLLERNLLTPVELYRFLQQSLAKKLLDLFSWNDGEFEIEPSAIPARSPLKVNVPQLVLTGVTRFADQGLVDSAIGGWVGKKLTVHPQPPFPLDEIRLSTGQEQVVNLLRAGSRMDELAMSGLLPFAELNRLLYALAILGVAGPRDFFPAARDPLPVPSAPPSARTQPVPTIRPTQVVDDAERSNRVTEAYLRYRTQDAFDLLGLGEAASTATMQERYLEFAEKFAPWQFSASVAESARALFLAGAQAFGEITDPERRDALLFRRKTLREQAAKRPQASHGIKTDLLDPDVQFKKGQALLAAGQHRAAILQFEFASDCDPGNGLYRAELAFSRYLESPLVARQALRDLEEALRLDARCGLAAYYAGCIHGDLGEREAAETNLRRAIKLMAPDRRPIDALRELGGKKK